MASQKILIVDDSKTVRMQVKDMLPKGNFEILEAGDGMEGLELITQESRNLAVLLLDFFMPRLNGSEVVQQLQNNPRLRGIPIVMMSGRKEDVETTMPDLFEYFEFVSKPFEAATLIKAIRAAMVKAKARQQSTPIDRSPESEPVKPAETTLAVTPSSIRDSGADGIQTISAAMQELRQENAKLRAEVESLKKQVSQIMAFIRQKLK